MRKSSLTSPHQIASRDDELLSQRERYSRPVDNKRGITNDSKTNLRAVNKEDMDLDSKIRQNLEEVKHIVIIIIRHLLKLFGDLSGVWSVLLVLTLSITIHLVRPHYISALHFYRIL
jgi:hypothetical protein